MYELLYGVPPFLSKSPNKLFDKITHEKPGWEGDRIQISDQAKDFLKILLDKNSEYRLLSCQNGALMKHKWFEGFDWKSLECFGVEPPVPGARNDDLRWAENFDVHILNVDYRNDFIEKSIHDLIKGYTKKHVLAKRTATKEWKKGTRTSPRRIKEPTRGPSVPHKKGNPECETPNRDDHRSPDRRRTAGHTDPRASGMKQHYIGSQFGEGITADGTDPLDLEIEVLDYPKA